MSKKLAETFRANLRYAMHARDITQADLAVRIGCTPSYVSQLLSGHRNPGLDTLESVAEALEIDASDLLAEKNLSRSA